jgi:hypothetical protein
MIKQVGSQYVGLVNRPHLFGFVTISESSIDRYQTKQSRRLISAAGLKREKNQRVSVGAAEGAGVGA